MTRVIYISPNFDDVEKFMSLSDEEKSQIAKEEAEMTIFTLEELECAFNEGLISDLGYLKIVNL